MSNKMKTRENKKMKGEMTMGKKTSNNINNYNEVMALIYALYMTVGSLFSSVSCIFEKEKNFFRSRYLRMAIA